MPVTGEGMGPRNWIERRRAGRVPRRLSLSAPEPIAGWVNLAAGIATFVSIGASALVAFADDPGWYAVVPVVFLCLLATGALVLLAYQQLVFDRHRRYVLAIPTLQDAFRVLGEATYAVIAGQIDERAFRRAIRDAIGSLAMAFTQVTGTRCRVSIKTVAAVPEALGKTHLGPDDFAVTTLCRSGSERADGNRAGPDLIARNTDFRAIFQGQPYYFNNDLVGAARRFEYENSHWDQEAIRKDRVDYRSTIIWPVTPVDLDEATEPGKPHPPVIAFVCLDNAIPHVFSEQFDVALGQSFTHALNLALWALDRARRERAKDLAHPGRDEAPVRGRTPTRGARRAERQGREPGGPAAPKPRRSPRGSVPPS